MPVSQQVSHVFLANTPKPPAHSASACGNVGVNQERVSHLRRCFILVFLSIDDVGQRLNVSRSTVYRLIRAGELDVIHIGAAIRISEESLESYIATHMTFGTAVAR